MSVPKSQGYPVASNKTQPAGKGAQAAKPTKKAWDASDFASETVSI
jgi:hypothetical protein